LASSEAAPTELKISHNREEHRVAKLKHVSRSVFKASDNLELFSALTLTFWFNSSVLRLKWVTVSSKLDFT
jgi:hypothetical protein